MTWWHFHTIFLICIYLNPADGIGGYHIRVYHFVIGWTTWECNNWFWYEPIVTLLCDSTEKTANLWTADYFTRKKLDIMGNLFWKFWVRSKVGGQKGQKYTVHKVEGPTELDNSSQWERSFVKPGGRFFWNKVDVICRKRVLTVRTKNGHARRTFI